MTVDQTTGKLFVSDYFSGSGCMLCVSLIRFPPAAAGNSAPFARSVSSEFPTGQLASDSTGNNIITAHPTFPLVILFSGIETIAKQFPNNTVDPSPYQVGKFLPTGGIADDPTTKTYLATGSADTTIAPPNFGYTSGIFRLAESTVGDFAANDQGFPTAGTLQPKLVSVITNDGCGRQLALGYLRNIYVTHNVKLGGCSSDAVYVYPHDSSGDVSPLRVLSGLATKLDEPYGIYEGQ